VNRKRLLGVEDLCIEFSQLVGNDCREDTLYGPIDKVGFLSDEEIHRPMVSRREVFL
jgi:hypothetical protein